MTNPTEFGTLPKHLAGLPDDALVARFPLEWREGTRNDIWMHLLTVNAAASETVRSMGEKYLYPPRVADKFLGLVTRADPDIIDFACEPLSADQAQAGFMRDVLHIDSGSTETVKPSYITASDVTVPGIYPMGKLAEALQAKPEDIHRELERYAGGRAMLLQCGTYFGEIAGISGNPVEAKVGQFWKLTESGHKLWQYIKNDLIEDMVGDNGSE